MAPLLVFTGALDLITERGCKDTSLCHNDIKAFSVQPSISHSVFTAVRRGKCFSSHRLGHTCLTLFFPITNAFIIIHPLPFIIGDFSLTITRAVGGPRRLTPGTALALLSSSSWPFLYFLPILLGLNSCYAVLQSLPSPWSQFARHSPGCSCFFAVYILTTSPSRVLHLQDPSQIRYSFSEHNRIPRWIMLTMVHTDLGLRRWIWCLDWVAGINESPLLCRDTHKD